MASASVGQSQGQYGYWASALLLACLLMPPAYGATADVPGAKKEKTPAENVNIAKSPAKDEEERTAAIEALSRVTSELERNNNIIDALLGIVKNDNNIFIRISAIKALGVLQANVTPPPDSKAKKKYITPFAAILTKKENHGALRKAVADVFAETLVLGGLEDGDVAYPALKEIAKSKAEALGLRQSCILAIGEFGSPDAIEVLAAILNESEDLKEAAAQAIDKLLIKASGEVTLSVPTVNKLVDMMKDKALPEDLRIAVMKLLARLIRENNTTARNEAFPLIVELLDPVKSKHDVMPLSAAEALGIVGSAETVDPLVKAYDRFYNPDQVQQPTDVAVRQAVVRALRNAISVQGDKRTPEAKAIHQATTLLVKAASNDGSPAVQLSAAYALRYVYKFDVEHKEAVVALVGLLSKKDEALKKTAVESLNFITGLGLPDDVRRWNAYADKKYPGALPNK